MSNFSEINDKLIESTIEIFTGMVMMEITVAGEPKVKVGEPVAVDGLVAIPWSQGDRSGVAFRATSIRPADAQSGVLGPRPTAGGSSQTTPGAK